MITRPSVLTCIVMLLGTLAAAPSPAAAAEPVKGEPLAGTQPLTFAGDLSLKMVDDLHVFADRLTAESVERRARHWKRDFSSREAYEKSIEPNRARLAKYLGFRDPFTGMEHRPIRFLEDDGEGGHGPGFRVGHYLQTVPRGFETDVYVWSPTKEGEIIDDAPTILLLLDADQVPDPMGRHLVAQDDSAIKTFETIRRFLERGYCVIVPRLIDRGNELSVVAGVRRTPQPHREFLYRQAFEMGRHLIGYELQAISALLTQFGESAGKKRFAVAGYGEGGMLALYLAALDPRVAVVGVSGYFGPRERLWEEPIYRNVWALLDEFGNAELAAMIAPNRLIVEAAGVPQLKAEPASPEGRPLTPGTLRTPALDDVRREVDRARSLIGAQPGSAESVKLIAKGDGSGEPWSDEFLQSLSEAFGQPKTQADSVKGGTVRIHSNAEEGSAAWQRMYFESLVRHTQDLVEESEYVRKDFFNNADRKSRDPGKWEASLEPYRKHLYDEVLGRFDLPKLPPNARTRKIYDTPKYTGYEVVLDVFGAKPGDGNVSAGGSDVWAFGILLVPKDLKAGEKRPVVVCQHGLEGRPEDTIRGDVPGARFYHEFAAKLADRGFVTFSPQNPYIGKIHFRQLVRKLYPLKKTLWSVIVPQHEQITDWLASLEFVDPQRIGFYGLSYGGKTAMRVPALVPRYCLSICSGDFNEWIRKCTSVRDAYSYIGTGEYEMFEFDLGHTFNYAEMAYLIAPRPFMVERGHRDGVGVDEWVSYEFAKVRMLYADLKIPERTEIEYFDGPHEIHAVGTFDFLHRHLNWPAPKE